MGSVRFAWDGARDRALALCAALALVFLACLPAMSQVNTGRISGTVTDQTGGVIAGATVTIIDPARGLNRPLTTDSAGAYSAPNLTPGTYTVQGEAPGFQQLQRQNVTVEVGGDVRLDLQLVPGAQTQTVTVTGELPVMNTTNTQLGGTLENNTINSLPLNGRNYRSLANELPGVFITPGGGTEDQSTNGGRTDGDNYLVDGLYDTAVYNGQSTLGAPSESGDTTVLPLDAIQEVTLVENPMAEYGWQPGVQVNVGLKSGTNQMHGTAYAYGRDGALVDKNAFATIKPDQTFEQFGASLGGPIKKDKIFYFGAYEGERLSIGDPQSIVEPTTAALAGAGTSCVEITTGNCATSVPDAIADINAANQKGTVDGKTTLSPLGVGMLGCNPASPDITSASAATVALACGPGAAGAPASLFGNSSTSTSVSTNIPNVGGNDNALGKIDYHINDKNSLNGEYSFGRYSELAQSTTAIVQPWWRELLKVRTQVTRVVEVWTPSSTWVNEVRIGYDHDSRPVITGECAQPGTGPNYNSEYGFVTTAPESCGFPTTTISGFAQLGFGNDRVIFDSDLQGADTVSHTIGAHQIKLGVDIRSERFMGSKYTDSEEGVLNFGTAGVNAFGAGGNNATALEDFLAGVPSSETIRFGNPLRTVYFQQFGAFIQDDWRVKPRLTLNIGLRYEYQTPADVSHQQAGNFVPGSPTGMVTTGVLWKVPPYQFAPRVGIVWDPWGKGQTIFRAGGSMVYTTQLIQGFASGIDLTTIPTGAVLYEANGTTIQPPANGIAAATIATGGGLLPNSTTVNATSKLPWTTGVSPFPAAIIQCGNGVGTNPAPCNTQGATPTFETYTSTWTVSVEHAFTPTLTLNVAYVGTHGTGLLGTLDVNQPTPGPISGVGTGTGTSTAVLELERSPYYSAYPYLNQIKFGAPIDDSNYNGMQATITKRISHGLSFTGGYTLAHALDYASANTGPGFVEDSTRPNLDYANSVVDARNRAVIIASYQIPGRKSPGQLLEGWKVNMSINLLGRLPFNADDTTDDVSGTGVLVDRWTMTGNPNSFQVGPAPMPCYSLPTGKFASSCTIVASMPTACVNAAMGEPNSPSSVAAPDNTGVFMLDRLGCYMEGNLVIVPPAQGTYGNMVRDALRGPAFHVTDFSVNKTWTFKERYGAEFRAEAFNVFNDTEYDVPSANLGAPASFGKSGATPDVNKGNPLVGSGGPRAIQLALRLSF